MQGTLRVVTAVGIATILYKALAALQQLLLARVLGATASADAYFLAQVLPVLLAGLLYSALSTSTLFMIRDHKQPGALSGLLLQVSGAMLMLAGLVWLLGSWFLQQLAPAATAVLVSQAAWIQLLLLPVLVCQSISGVLTGILLAQRKLLAPPLAIGVMYGCGLLGLWLTTDGSATLLAVGLAVGATLQVAVLLFLSRKSIFVKPVFSLSLSRGLASHAIPALGCNAISTMLLVTDRSFAAGFGPGQLAAISYIYSLITLPTQIIVNTVVGVSMPGWVARSNDPLAFSEAVTKSLALLSFALLPVALFMGLGAGPITGLALGTSRFSSEQIANTAVLLSAYSAAIIGFAAKDALTAAALAQGKAAIAFAIGLTGVGIAVVAKWSLAPVFGLKAAAIGTSLALLFCGLALIYKLTSEEISARYWHYSRGAVLSAIPALTTGLAFSSLTGNQWISVAAALFCYLTCWYLLGGAAAGQQLLRGRW